MVAVNLFICINWCGRLPSELFLVILSITLRAYQIINDRVTFEDKDSLSQELMYISMLE